MAPRLTSHRLVPTLPMPDPNGPLLSPSQGPESRFRSFRTRAISTVVLIGLFVGIIAAGHVPLMFMILGIQVRDRVWILHKTHDFRSAPCLSTTHAPPAGPGAPPPRVRAPPCPRAQPATHALELLQCLMVREMFALARVAQQEKKVPGFRAQQWYFFFVAAFAMYIRQVASDVWFLGVVGSMHLCWAGGRLGLLSLRRQGVLVRAAPRCMHTLRCMPSNAPVLKRPHS